MRGAEKAWPVVLREGARGYEVLVFRHPLAGVQLVKGTIEPGEAFDAAARRELLEEAGLSGLVPLGDLAPLCPGAADAVWHFSLFDGAGLPHRWTHRCADDGGHDFAFFWHRLADTPDADWHPVFVVALDHIRAHLVARPLITIRQAVAADAEAAAALLRRSITQLCAPDHGNDRARLDHWLINKTPEQFRDWLADPANTILVAAQAGRILGIGGVREGEGISLNYVDPAARFMGISERMIMALEAMLRERGVAVAYLTSTITARRFYEARGYVERDLPAPARAPFGIDMEKWLAAGP